MNDAGEIRDAGPRRTLSEDQREALLEFLGYGNPAGRFWFVGIEEHGAGDDETSWCELLVRANYFERIEDLKRAQEHPSFASFGSPFRIDQYVPTWRIMCKTVLRLLGEPEWQSPERTGRYQAEQLGRLHGETFLTDLLPLPAPSVSDWPYTTLYRTRHAYVQDVLPGRLDRLRRLMQKHLPSYVFCYGKGYWEQYRKLFEIPEAEYEPIVGGAMRLGRTARGTLIVLMPFLAPFLVGNVQLEEMARRLRADRFIWHDGDVTIIPPPHGG